MLTKTPVYQNIHWHLISETFNINCSGRSEQQQARSWGGPWHSKEPRHSGISLPPHKQIYCDVTQYNLHKSHSKWLLYSPIINQFFLCSLIVFYIQYKYTSLIFFLITYNWIAHHFHNLFYFIVKSLPIFATIKGFVFLSLFSSSSPFSSSSSFSSSSFSFFLLFTFSFRLSFMNFYYCHAKNFPFLFCFCLFHLSSFLSSFIPHTTIKSIFFFSLFPPSIIIATPTADNNRSEPHSASRQYLFSYHHDNTNCDQYSGCSIDYVISL